MAPIRLIKVHVVFSALTFKLQKGTEVRRMEERKGFVLAKDSDSWRWREMQAGDSL